MKKTLLFASLIIIMGILFTSCGGTVRRVKVIESGTITFIYNGENGEHNYLKAGDTIFLNLKLHRPATNLDTTAVKAIVLREVQ